MRAHPQPRAAGRPRSFWLFLVPLIGAALGARPAAAAPNAPMPAINLTYRGGPMLQQVKVAVLFWGSPWKGSSLADYFDGFFHNLFADGRFMANLDQYSTESYTIGNGSFAAADTDTQDPPAMVTDAQIRSEIRAREAAGHLPKTDPNTVYFVFTPPGVVVTDNQGKHSGVDFFSYHDVDFASDGFAYAVIAYDSNLQDPRLMTMYASHELSETVTDPEPSNSTVAWYDDNYGEVADIPATLFADNVIGFGDFADELDAPDGTPYLVQKVWSNQDNAPVAFAAPG